MSQNIQVLLETVVRCGGNCSGCALSSVERMSEGGINWDVFKKKSKEINQYLLNMEKKDDIEAISIFLGQGDHFLLSESEMVDFVDTCSQIVPHHLYHKTVIFITASAIGKHEKIKNKMDLLFDLSVEKKLPFFIQVVFDPKKMLVTSKFAKTYMDNILYFKNKCGMTELTINLGNDLFQNLTPNQFHDWTIKYGFKHIEMNWVLNEQTKNMWEHQYTKMFNWLKELLILNAEDHQYEINFVPFLYRALKINESNDFSQQELFQKIKSSLAQNIYIDNIGNTSYSQVGLVSNLIPMNERLKETSEIIINDKTSIYKTSDIKSKKIISNIFKQKSCSNCQFQNTCSLIGTSSWLKFKNINTENNDVCPWGIKDFLSFMSSYFSKYPHIRNTYFDRNPIQSSLLDKENNSTHYYFEENFKNFDK